MNRIISYQISEEDALLTVEQFLRRKGYSAKSLSRLRHADPFSTFLNEAPCILKQPMRKGDVLKVSIHEEAGSPMVPPKKIPLSILYEDEDLIVIDKPAGLAVHPSRENYYHSLANALAWYYQQQGETFVFRCINRIDEDTSGLVLVAKHFVSAGILSQMRTDHRLKKEYLGIACGWVYPEQGEIDAPIAKKPGHTIERVIDPENGVQALTRYRLLEVKNGYSLLKFELPTGRTHQIRIHMRELGFPLAGDPLYNPACRAAAFLSDQQPPRLLVPEEISGISRQALHAWHLSLPHPITNQAMEFTAPLPEDMKKFGFSPVSIENT